MPRGKSAPKIQREPDQVYKSRVVAKLINMVMQDGKKSIAQKIVYNSIESLSEDSKEARRAIGHKAAMLYKKKVTVLT